MTLEHDVLRRGQEPRRPGVSVQAKGVRAAGSGQHSGGAARDRAQDRSVGGAVLGDGGRGLWSAGCIHEV